MGCTSGAIAAPKESVLRVGCWTKTLPKGVVGNPAPLASKAPPRLCMLLESKCASSLYDQMAKELKHIHKGHGRYDITQVGGVLRDYSCSFQDLGISIYLCEFLDIQYFHHQWFEFVDLDVNSEYQPKERILWDEIPERISSLTLVRNSSLSMGRKTSKTPTWQSSLSTRASSNFIYSSSESFSKTMGSVDSKKADFDFLEEIIGR